MVASNVLLMCEIVHAYPALSTETWTPQAIISTVYTPIVSAPVPMYYVKEWTVWEHPQTVPSTEREFVLCHNCPRLIGDRINSAERRIKESCVLIRVGMFMMTYLSEQVPCLPSFDGCYEFCVC